MKFTSKGPVTQRRLSAGEVVGKVFTKTNNTGYIDKDYQKTPFGEFLVNTKNSNCVLSVHKKTGDIYAKTRNPLKAGSVLTVDFRALDNLGPKQKDKPTDYLTKPKNDFESNRETEIGNVYGNYLAGTNWGKSYNA